MTRFHPQHWPVCSACYVPFVVRRSLVYNMKKGTTYMRWLWQRDCRHKKGKPEIASRSVRPTAKRKKGA